MPALSKLAQCRKCRYFLDRIPKEARILEIGCGSGWVTRYLKENGWRHYTGLDLVPPADLVGDIKQWRELGLAPESFDVIIAFEVVEHVDCFQECQELLRPGGMLMVTTPLPCMDWAMRLLEAIGLNQKRTSPHRNLVYLSRVPGFREKKIRLVGLLSQWGVLIK